MSDRTAGNGTFGRLKPGETPPRRKNARGERLAAALRANLKRRKQQARARKADGPASEAPGDKH